MNNDKERLGLGTFAQLDNSIITLTSLTSESDCETVYLDKDEFANLIKFAQKIGWLAAEEGSDE